MVKAFVFIPAILVFIFPAYEGLICYECFMGVQNGNTMNENEYKMVKCNEQNLSASQVLQCPDQRSKCVYQVVEIEAIGTQIWRKCSDPRFQPCDPEALPHGTNMIKCSSCETDRCNLEGKNSEENTYTISINANVSLSILK